MIEATRRQEYQVKPHLKDQMGWSMGRDPHLVVAAEVVDVTIRGAGTCLPQGWGLHLMYSPTGERRTLTHEAKHVFFCEDEEHATTTLRVLRGAIVLKYIESRSRPPAVRTTLLIAAVSRNRTEHGEKSITA